MDAAVSDELLIRRSLRDGDESAIVDLHRRVYVAEYGRNDAFVSGVRQSIERARADGWPERQGAVWLLESLSRLEGSLGLTLEDDGLGHVRWFVLGPALRGHGLGSRLVEELVDLARAQRLTRLELETFSALRAAAHIYRNVGFRLVWERPREDWGPPITYQHYALELR